LETEHAARNRKYLYEVLLILIAIAAPELGLVAEGFLLISLLILTEVSMIIARRIEKTREASE
jgi:Sec-independent protein secretion pathway component TatC